MPDIDKLLRDKEVAEILGCSTATFWRRVQEGTIPRPLKIGGLSRWKRSWVEAVIDQADRARQDTQGKMRFP